MNLVQFAADQFQKARDKRAFRELEILERNYNSVSYMIPCNKDLLVQKKLEASVKDANSRIALRDFNNYLAQNVQPGLTVQHLVYLANQK
jgi:hypothetical protein